MDSAPGGSRNFGRFRNNQTFTPNNNRYHPRRSPSVQEVAKIENAQRQSISDNFSSPKLTYGGSDVVIEVPLGSEYEKLWKKMIKNELKNQHSMRRFINSCLVTADKKDEVGLLVNNLGSSDGMRRIREIVMFEMSVDAGLKPDIASFQRVVLPFLALLTRKTFSDCTLELPLNAIYSVIFTNLVIFFHFSSFLLML